MPTRHSARSNSKTSAMLPTPPAVLARVVALAGDPDRSLQELGAACAQDAGLTVELLRAANSARHHNADPVRSVPQAVIKIGARAVRALAISYTVRAAVGGLRTGQFDARAFWEDSLRRAAAAQLVAEEIGYDDPHEAFAVGLTQDVGTLLLATGEPKAAESLSGLRTRPGRTRLEAERVLTGSTHTEAILQSDLLAPLPYEFRFAVQHHHQPPTGTSRAHTLARIAHVADLVGDVVQAFPKGRCIALAATALRELGVDRPMGDLINDLARRVTRLGQELRMDVGEQPKMNEVQRIAKRALAKLDAPPALTTPPPKRDLSKKPTTDALTGLDTQEVFQGEIRALAGAAAGKGLLLINLDHLARVNGAFGHSVGDAALCHVAQQISRVASQGDRIARLGGDQFVLLVSGSKEKATLLGQAIRRAVARHPVRHGGAMVPVTVSIGAAWAEGPVAPGKLVIDANAALQAAKRAGRDRLQWGTAAPAQTAPANRILFCGAA